MSGTWTSPRTAKTHAVWEAPARAMLAPLVQVGAAIRVRKCLALAFNAKTAGFTTSRLPLYLKITPESEAEALSDGDPD